MRLIDTGGVGTAAARNAGAAAARGPLLLFLDDDVVAAPDLVLRHAEAHRGGERAVIGHCTPRPRTSNLTSLGAVNWWEDHFRAKRDAVAMTFVDVLSGNMSVSRETFEQLGGFDPALGRREDWEWGIRLLEAGVEAVYEPRARADHEFSLTAARAIEAARRDGRSDARLIARYPAAAVSLPRRWAYRSMLRRPLKASLFLALRHRPARRLGLLALALLEAARARVYWARLFGLMLGAAYESGRRQGGDPRRARVEPPGDRRRAPFRRSDPGARGGLTANPAAGARRARRGGLAGGGPLGGRARGADRLGGLRADPGRAARAPEQRERRCPSWGGLGGARPGDPRFERPGGGHPAERGERSRLARGGAGGARRRAGRARLRRRRAGRRSRSGRSCSTTVPARPSPSRRSAARPPTCSCGARRTCASAASISPAPRWERRRWCSTSVERALNAGLLVAVRDVHGLDPARERSESLRRTRARAALLARADRGRPPLRPALARLAAGILPGGPTLLGGVAHGAAWLAGAIYGSAAPPAAAARPSGSASQRCEGRSRPSPAERPVTRSG